MKKSGYTSIFLLTLVLYGVSSYAGIRSPDSEVVFETCDSLLHRRSFRVMGESSWEGFGLAPGRNGASYSIFGPLEALACVPVLAVADAVDSTHWFEAVTPPRSHYIDGGIRAVLTQESIGPPSREMHARRALVAWSFNTIIGAFTVLAFLHLALRFSKHRASALVLTGAYACGSLLWPYSGTFFSEPLTTFFLLVSLDGAVAGSADWQGAGSEVGPTARRGATTRAGAALALAAAAHITALLFLPFWLAIAARAKTRRACAAAAGCFLIGAFAVLAPLAFYNHARFGSIWETGRSFRTDQYGYGVFQAPWRGLWGLVGSPGKGLLLFCPVVLLGFAGWRRFAARSRPARFLALMLAAALMGRCLFVAARSDWHGGFCLGPRYLLPAVPFLLLPGVALLDDLVSAGRRRSLIATLVFVWACTLQQLYFVLGEIFSYLHYTKWKAAVAGRDVFANDDLYLRPLYSPLVGLLDGLRGPFLLKAWPGDNQSLWLAGALIVSAIWLWAGRAALAAAVGHLERAR